MRKSATKRFAVAIFLDIALLQQNISAELCCCIIFDAAGDEARGSGLGDGMQGPGR